MVTLITRAQWGARPPTEPLTRVPWSEREGTAVHYTQGNKTDTPLQLQHYAQSTLGFKDGHYNTLVDYRGRAYEGRGWVYSSAHSEGENREWVSIAFIGKDTDVTPAAEITITALIDDVNQLAGRALKLAGHKELPGAQTSCPGPRLMTLVDRIRNGGSSMITNDQIYSLITTGDRSQTGPGLGGDTANGGIFTSLHLQLPQKNGLKLDALDAKIDTLDTKLTAKIDEIQKPQPVPVDVDALIQALGPAIRAIVREEIDATELRRRSA